MAVIFLIWVKVQALGFDYICIGRLRRQKPASILEKRLTARVFCLIKI